MTPQLEQPRTWNYDELVREGLSLIPAHAPGWTNHNPSDPGITLVELLAYFTEVLAYRLSRVTPEARLHFLRLLKGSGWTGWKPLAEQPAERFGHAVDEAIDEAIRELGQAECAVTAADFEQLAVGFAKAELGPEVGVRALALPGLDLESNPGGDSRGDKRAHVSVVLQPEYELEHAMTERLCERVRRQLEGHCLLTTRLHVVGPSYVHLAIGFSLALKPGSTREQALGAVEANLRRRFGPRLADEGPGDAARSWGEPVRVTDITEAIDNAEGVDYVEALTLSSASRRAETLFDETSRIGIQVGIHATVGRDARLGMLPGLGTQRLQRDEAGRLAAITLRPWEVAHLHLAPDEVRMVEPAASRRSGFAAAGDGR